MRDLFILAIHLLVSVAKLLRPGGVRTVAAESLLLKHQLQISNRFRHRAPNLTTLDRFVLGLTSLFVNPRCIAKLVVILKPATLLRFHKALVDRKYRLLFSSSGIRRRPGPNGPSPALIAAIAEMKTRNPKIGYLRIAQQVPHAYGIEIDKDVVRRALSKHYHPEDFDSNGPSWLSFLAQTKDSLWNVDLIGKIRREYLERTFFWNAPDLARKLDDFRTYYNAYRVHRSIDDEPPAQRSGAPTFAPAKLASFAWKEHCPCLFKTPTTA